MNYYDRVWVIARAGDFDSVLDPLLKRPSLGGGFLSNPTLKVTKIVTMDPNYDPFTYATAVLSIDPLLLVWHRSDLDLKGIHRYGYVFVNVPKKRFEFVYPQNEKGIYDSASMSLLRRFILKPYPMSCQPASLSTNTDHSRYIDPWSIPDSIKAWAVMADGIKAVPENTPLLSSIARLDTVDWEKMLHTAEVSVDSKLSDICTKYADEIKSGEAVDWDHTVMKARDPEFLFRDALCGRYGRPARWIPTVDPMQYAELYALYQTIPSVIIREGEVRPSYPGAGTTEGYTFLKEHMTAEKAGVVESYLKESKSYLTHSVFTDVVRPFYIAEFMIVSAGNSLKEFV